MSISYSEFSGTAPGLSLIGKRRHFLNGTLPRVTSMTEGQDELIEASSATVSAKGLSNPALCAGQGASALAPTGTGQVLRISYPANSSSPGDHYMGDTPSTTALAGQLRPNGGTQASISFPFSSTRMRIRYGVKVPVGFDWRQGGKLPGISSKSVACSGGEFATCGTTSFTGRMMWKTGGKLESYFYMADNTTRWGVNYGANVNNLPNVYLVSGWNIIESEIWMNDIGKANGGAICKLNGVEFVNRSDLTWRTVDTLKCDAVYFSTFFGGSTDVDGDNTWETLVDTYLEFSDIEVSFL